MLVAVDVQDTRITEAFFRLLEKRPQTSSDLQAEEGGDGADGCIFLDLRHFAKMSKASMSRSTRILQL